MVDHSTLSRQNIRIQKYITVIAIVLFAVKFFAWYITNSVAIYTDALESVVNIVSGFLGLYSLYFAARPKDENHPYGHGKIEFVSAAIEGAFITLAGIIIMFRVADVTNGNHTLERLDWGIGLIALTGLVNYFAGFIAVMIGKKNNSIALQASGRHLQTDTYSTLGILIGLTLLIITGLAWIDAAIAILFAILIIVLGVRILRRAIAGIMDEADPELIQDVVTFLNDHRRPNWIDLHNLRIIKYGSILHFDAHLTVPWYLNIRDAHIEQEHLAQLIRQKYGRQVELFAHLDPCQEFSCRICTKDDCHVRQHPFEGKITWTVENVVRNHKHTVYTD